MADDRLADLARTTYYGMPAHADIAPWRKVAAAIRADVLAEAARELQDHATARLASHGGDDPRGAALWDAACHLVEEMGDGNWRRPTGDDD